MLFPSREMCCLRRSHAVLPADCKGAVGGESERPGPVDVEEVVRHLHQKHEFKDEEAFFEEFKECRERLVLEC